MQASKSYIKALKSGATDEQLVNGAYEYAQWCERNGTDKEYICHPATWPNQGRWKSDYRADDGSKQTTGSGDSNRQSQTSLAIVAAAKTAQKKVKVAKWNDDQTGEHSTRRSGPSV